MANALPKEYEKVYQLNVDLLELARQGNWDAFINQAELYVAAVSEVLESQPANMREEDEQHLVTLFRCLLNNEDEIEKALKQRLDFLSKDMSSLHIGKKCSEAYTKQYTSAFH